MLRHPALPYVAPFAIFIGFLSLKSSLPLGGLAGQIAWIAAVSASIWFFSRHLLDFRLRMPLGTIVVGAIVFAIWIAPDALFPGYRSHWLFQNSITGTLTSSLPPELRENLAILVLRSARAILIVPIVEELFWRGWMLRWLINPDFEKVPLGTYSHLAFWGTAILFAAEHGPFWEVGLIAGAIYNWWMMRSKSLGDLIVAHGLTNGLLCAYVVATGKWEYWL
ncbi:MAG: CAAX prenyl protease-related protein [Bryobacteraceae bacterium]